MGCSGSKAAAAPPQKAPGLLAKDAATEKKAAGNVSVYGVPPSMNCLGAILLVTVNGCGKMEKCMPFQDTITEEFLKMNPFHAVPTLKDGDFCLAESNAVLRYVGETYAKEAYPTDPKLRGTIDWAMDRFSSAYAPDAVTTVYPLLGFAEPPADQAAAGKKCTENLNEFCTVFLSKGKFVGGEKPSIADYKVAPFFFAYEHAAVQEKSSVACPDRVKQFNKDFAAAIGEVTAQLFISAGGFSLGEMLDAKLAAAEPVVEIIEEVKEEVKEEERPIIDTFNHVPVEVPVVPTRNCC